MSHTTHPTHRPVSVRNRKRPRPAFDKSTYLVPPAMMVVAVAMGVASHLHLGISPDMAIAVSAALFCAMLLSHVLLRAADLADRAEEEAETRRAVQVPSPMPTIPEASLPVAPVEGNAPALAPMAGDVATIDQMSRDAEFGRGLGSLAAQDVAPIGGRSPQTAAEPTMPDPAVVPSGWTMRPADVVFAPDPAPAPVVAGPVPQEVAAAIGSLRPTLAEHALPRGGAAEADRIDQILKRLAHEIKAESLPTAPVVDAEAAAPQSDTALASAVDALRSTVEAMKVAVQPAAVPQEAEPVQMPVSAPAPVAQFPATPVEARIAAVAEALAAERIDVVLAPILGLANSEAEHFEVTVRLRAEDGSLLDARADAPGAGLLPLLDAVSVRHATGFALKLDRRGRPGAVFSQVAAESLQSPKFVGDVAERYAQGVSDRMVLSFAQADVRSLGEGHIEVLDELSRLGFRFAMAGVADLDMDFETLRAHGFQFVKLEAGVFLNGLPCGDAIVPASDLCRYFTELGFGVIVSGIDDAYLRATLMACGVSLGQGQLYGEPRPVPYAAGAVAA